MGGACYDESRMPMVAAYLIALRQERKINQNDVASAIGLSLRQYNRWENGEAENLKDFQFLQLIWALAADLEHIRYLLDLNNEVDAGLAVAFARAQAGMTGDGQPVADPMDSILRTLDAQEPDLARPLRGLLAALAGRMPR